MVAPTTTNDAGPGGGIRGGGRSRPACRAADQRWGRRAVTRIIAGEARGRRLSVPPGTRTRPTSDRAREGLFATITARHGPLGGTAFLDLYAGSGAVGLEALSRGAAPVLFVES